MTAGSSTPVHEREVVIINESGEDKDIAIELQNFTPGDTLYRYEVHFDSLGSRAIYVNNRTADGTPTYGPADYESIVPYQQTLSDSAPIIAARKYSVNFVVVAP